MEHFEISIEEALSFEREIGNGNTNPLLMRCTNDTFVVKVMENPEGPRVLINELVCYKLAKLLGLPIPNAALIHINNEMIQSSKRLQELGIRPGIHFGSKFIKKSTPSIQPPMLRIAVNTDDIPSIILFDQIIYNDDRTENKGNLLFDLKEKKIIIIDHTHVFKIGALWDKYQLEQIHKEPLTLVKDFHGHNYKVLLKYINGFNPFHKVMVKISQLTKSDIEWCCDEIPESWGLNSDDKNGLIEFIWYRIKNKNVFLDLLKDKCPDWKGGELDAI